jgi:hypothetical protein
MRLSHALALAAATVVLAVVPASAAPGAECEGVTVAGICLHDEDPNCDQQWGCGPTGDLIRGLPGLVDALVCPLVDCP